MISVGSVMIVLLFVETLAWSCFSEGGLFGNHTIIDLRSQKGRKWFAWGEGFFFVFFELEVSVRVTIATERLSWVQNSCL